MTNCMCGLASSRAPQQRRHDLRCRVLPYFYGATPGVMRCPEYLAQEVRAVHYAGEHKPWTKEPDNAMMHLWQCFKDTPTEQIKDRCKLEEL